MKSILLVCVVAMFVWFPARDGLAEDSKPEWLENYDASLVPYQDKRFDEALPLAEAAYEGYARIHGERGLDFGYLANRLGSIYLLLDRSAEAVPLFEKALKILSVDKQSPPPALAAIATNLAISHQRDFRIEAARPLFRRAVELLEATEGAKSEALADSYLRYGRSVLSVDHAAAVTALDKAVAYATEAFGKRHGLTGVALILRARADLAAGRYEEARKNYGKAQRAVARRGQNISGVQRILFQDLGLLEGLRGRYDRMIGYYRDAGVGIAQPPRFANNYQPQPACPKDANGNYLRAWMVIQFSILADGSVGTPEIIASHPPGLIERQALKIIKNWRFSAQMRDMSQARRSFQRIMVGCEQRDHSSEYDTAWQSTNFSAPDQFLTLGVPGGDSELAAAVTTSNRLGADIDITDRNQLDGLETALLQALKLARKAYGGDGPQLVNYYRNLGRLDILRDRANGTERYLKRARNIARRQKDTSVDDLVGAYWDYAACVALVHNDGKLIRETERLIDVLEQNRRPAREIIKAKLALASEFRWKTRPSTRKTMRRHLGDVVTLTSKVGDNGTALKAKALMYLGESHLRGQEFAEARDYFEEIDAMALGVLDETAPIRRFAHQGLGAIAYSQGNRDEAEIHRTIAASGPTKGEDLHWTAMPINRVAPKYPAKAEQYGIQGWTAMEFDIDDQGMVIDGHPFMSYPPLVFDDASARAFEKWKYLPYPKAMEVNSKRPQVFITFQLQ